MKRIEPLLDVSEVANLLSCGVAHVKLLCRDKILPHTRTSGKTGDLRFRPQDVRDFADPSKPKKTKKKASR